MSYNFRRGVQFIGDISGSDESDRNTGIDFEVDYIAFGTDETGSFLSNSITVTDTGTTLVDGDRIQFKIEGYSLFPHSSVARAVISRDSLQRGQGDY